MDKGIDSSLFVNDGSFMEKFKQLQEKQQRAVSEEPKSSSSAATLVPLKTSVMAAKRPLDVKDAKKSSPLPASAGKLAFSLKQKSKVAVAPVKFNADEEEEEGREREIGFGEEATKRQKLGQVDVHEPSVQKGDVAPPAPSDETVRKVADKLASFVAKYGRNFEHVTRQKNPGDTPFKFLFDKNCADYTYYEYRLLEEEKLIAQSKESQNPTSHIANTSTSTSKAPSSSHRSSLQQASNYQTPASALYGTYEESSYSGGASNQGDSSGSSASDPIAMMEFYMKKAAQEERRRQPRQSKDEMPPPPCLQGPPKKGHHMGDFIPPEELEKFMSNCNDAAAQKAAKEAGERARIQADNIGHKLLSKMGWKEGEGLGSDKSGRADPVAAGNVKLNNLGVGAQQPGEVTAEDDIYEQYKKRMMLGYRYRPNPLNNPRKAYY
ncbi:SURP and G-patch domain-containing protein 1-like protein [Ananas comosus]|uniref:SURP and G-patch domain-containing protein 1-like protein n=1 Tax=Ananas comosus TaxID=4615 RepID=A0A199W9X8_ANACO|nr:SURP and G-patch domain-containing protein 1-like protein [Ananas comosus]XP_020109785.1 SURP and G-patch domain-containing protein 1-like protein [Ananas comosus]XP_020109786.1 SURP and G-patch domain-containing protein 1-like protein [Ananas comosus]OAY86048.1 SURP and G-patch domain-containing protein 1-like protein [Ananas comosus]